jgi:hypothetical protein
MDVDSKQEADSSPFGFAQGAERQAESDKTAVE